MTPERIRALRERLKMTQAEFARCLGLATRGAVSHLESGKHQARGPLLRLLEALEEQAVPSLLFRHCKDGRK